MRLRGTLFAAAIVILTPWFVTSATVVGQRSDLVEHIDEAWFRKSLVDEASHWLAATRTPNGFFNTNIDRRWRSMEPQSATTVTQSRLLYVLSRGFDLTQDPQYLAAIKAGTAFLIDHFRRRTSYDWYWRVAPDGLVIQQQNYNYRYYAPAFAIFGLSHAYRVTGDERFLDSEKSPSQARAVPIVANSWESPDGTGWLRKGCSFLGGGTVV